MSWIDEWAATAANRKLSGEITPAAIDADQYAYQPDPTARIGTWKLSSSTDVTLYGLQGGKLGRLVIVLNIGSNAITFARDQLSDSRTAPVIDNPLVLEPSTGALLWLDAETTQWSLVSTEPDPPVIGKQLAFEQSTPASLWTWVHGLNCYPQPVCTDNYGHRMEPGFQYPDINTVTAQFGSDTSGWLFIRLGE